MLKIRYLKQTIFLKVRYSCNSNQIEYSQKVLSHLQIWLKIINKDCQNMKKIVDMWIKSMLCLNKSYLTQ
jgi:hypothetical protein